MNFCVSNHQSVCIHLRTDRALWALESAENAGGGVALDKVTRGTDSPPAQCLAEPSMLPLAVASSQPSRSSSWKVPISDLATEVHRVERASGRTPA